MAPPMPARPPLPRPRLPAGSLPDPGASAVPLPSLVSVVARELRAPLSSMLAASETLLEQGKILDSSTVGNLLAAIRHSTIELVELVENLLCMSSIDAGRFALQRRALCPRDLCTEIQAVTAPMLQPRGQVLRVA